MSEKVEAYLERVARLRDDDPFKVLADAGEALLRSDVATDDVFDAADELRHIEDVKDFVSMLSKALSEQLDIRNKILYDLMLEKELPNFDRRGKKFYLTKTVYVQARKELGGTENPQLIEWLREHQLGGIAKTNVNANSLRGAINTWMETNPLEVIEDGEILEGEELYKALGLEPIHDEDSDHVVSPEEQYEQRKLDYESLHALMKITEEPYVGVKAGK